MGLVWLCVHILWLRFQSTHPVRGGTLFWHNYRLKTRISIHPPRAGWDVSWLNVCVMLSTFQSTHPVRGGTDALTVYAVHVDDFNPPTPCGVGPSGERLVSVRLYFNPPTPCGVGPVMPAFVHFAYFISIHPPRAGWDCDRQSVCFPGLISIHPPRAGWDLKLH